MELNYKVPSFSANKKYKRI
uniref:Uncharacterized protein n=1 Tax=Arundo donax TaxID=35708 RepID=A0A0A9AXM1_ARUDO